MLDSWAELNGEGIECTSWDGPVSDGALKTLIHHKARSENEYQPMTICFQNSESYFKVKTQIVTCIHGHLDTKNGLPATPATLLVLEYRLHPTTGHRFTHVYTSFTFRKAPTSTSMSPRVISYAPFPRPRLWHQDKQTIETEDGVSGKLGVGGGKIPLTVEGESHKAATRTHLQEFFAKGSAGIDPDEETGEDNTIWWKLEENKLQKHGILEVFRVAVLLERYDEDNDFVGIFTMDVYGSFTKAIGKLVEKASRFWRRATLDDPVRFSPTKMKLQGKTDGIDANALSSLVQDNDNGEGLHLPASYHLESFLPKEAFIGDKD